MEYDLATSGPWDLIVFSETIYSLGWLYPMFDLGMLAANLFEATVPNGRLLLANTFGTEKDWLMRPWLINTYHDLFRHVGYRLELDEVFCGTKDTVEMKVRMSLFSKPSLDVSTDDQ